MVQNMERERGISIDYNRSMFYWAPVSINNAQAQTFSQENKPDVIYGLAIMTEYRRSKEFWSLKFSFSGLFGLENFGKYFLG